MTRNTDSLRALGVLAGALIMGTTAIAVAGATAADPGTPAAAPRATATPTGPAIQPVTRPIALIPSTRPAPTVSAVRPVTQPAVVPSASPAATASTGPVQAQQRSILTVSVGSSTSATQRTSASTYSASCLSGNGGSASIAPTAPLPATSGTVLSVGRETACQVTQTSAGGTTTATSWSYVNPEGGVESGTGSTATVSIWHGNYPGFRYQVDFVNAYVDVAPSPSATPAPSATATPTVTPSTVASPSATTAPTPLPPQRPVGRIPLPAVIDGGGSTVLLPSGVETTAKQELRITVFCLPESSSLLDAFRERAPRGDLRTCAVSLGENGRVTLDAQVTEPTRVIAVLWAPSTPEHAVFLRFANWLVNP